MKRLSYEDLHDAEVRATDSSTGGQKGVKATQIGALDPVALLLIGRVAGVGATKYAPFNFLKGYDWAQSFNAGMRHAMLFWAGEDLDAETGLPHAAMATWHFHTLTAFQARGVGTDTRPPKLEHQLTALERAMWLSNNGLVSNMTAWKSVAEHNATTFPDHAGMSVDERPLCDHPDCTEEGCLR